MRLVDRKSNCYGCGKCSIICPVQAITMEEDEEGFLYPKINGDECIQCEKCKDTCIHNLSESIVHEQSVFGCYAKDSDIVNQTTSGGIFFLLAKMFISGGGIVYGAAYLEDMSVSHIRVNDMSQLKRLIGSKYVQSVLTDIHLKIKTDVLNGEKVLFSGTGCQVAAIRSFVGNADNLVCIEVGCMGCPSPAIWKRHIEDKQVERKIIGVNFRDKKDGWETPRITYLYNYGEECLSYENDMFVQGFSQALFLRPSCHRCAFKGKKSWADIKLGDFWGLKRIDPGFCNINGTSLVIVQTEIGNNIFNRIRNHIRLKMYDYRKAVTYNHYFELSIKASKRRKEFWNGFKIVDCNLNQLIKENLINVPNENEISAIRYRTARRFMKCYLEDNLKDFFEKNQYSRVAVYGVSEYGRMIGKLLKKAGVCVCCYIDKKFDEYDSTIDGIVVKAPFEIDSKSIDCIVVTASFYYNNILETLMIQGVDLNTVIHVGSVWS